MMFTAVCIVVGIAFSALVCLVHNVKSLSTMLDRRNAMSAEGKEFLEDFGFRLKINAYFERIWPGLKKVGPDSLMNSVYKVSVLGFVAILVISYAFPSVVLVAGPVLMFALGFFSVVGNSLKPNAEAQKFGKMILIPVCAIVPLSIAYQIDSDGKAANIKHMLSQFSLPYSSVLMLGVVICFVVSLVLILLLEKFQVVVVRTLVSRTLLLAKRLVLLGIITTVPDEVEARAMAKDAVTATMATLSFIGIVVGGVVALIKFIL